MAKEGLDQTRLALAALAAAFAKALGESDSTFSSRFSSALHAVYDEVREGPASNIGAMETLKWTQELMKQIKA